MANIIANHPKIYLTTAPSIRTIQLNVLHRAVRHAEQAGGGVSGPNRGQARASGITLALDADEIIKGVLDGKAQRVPTMLPSMHFGYDPSLKPVKRTWPRRRSSWPRRVSPMASRSSSTLRRAANVRDKEVAEAAAGQLTKAGIKTTLKTFEFVNYLNNMVYVHKAAPSGSSAGASP